MATVKELGHQFCGDLPNLTLHDGGVHILQFDICDSDWETVDSFRETYYVESYLPPNDYCVVRDIGKVIKPYLEPMPLDEDFLFYSCEDDFYNLSVNVRIMHYNEGGIGGEPSEEYRLTAHYSDVRTNRNGRQHKHEPYFGFLSRYNWKERLISPNQTIFVSFLHRSIHSRFYLGIAYMQDGNAHYREVDVAFPDAEYYVHSLYAFTAEDVLYKLKHSFSECPSVTESDLLYFTVNLMASEPAEHRIGYIKYVFDRRHFPQEKHLLFYNAFGVWETLELKGRDERSTQMEGTYAWIDNKYLKNTTELVTSHAHNTGYLSEVDHETLLDLANSSHVYLYDGGIIEDEITITELEDTVSYPRQEPMNAKITYRVADEQRKLKFQYYDDAVDVFDKTFDRSFE